MFNKIRLKIAAISLAVVMLTLLTQGTLAYYSTVGKATNVVTSGDIRLLIHEKTADGNPFPKEGVYIVPGDVVSKEVSIENDCKHPFYLRVKAVYGVNSEELSAADCFKLDINEEYWTLNDGWYYYNDVVKPGDTTPNVFSKVEIVGNKVDNSYLGKILTLSVVAQAVQSENNPLVGTETYTASGWPKE